VVHGTQGPELAWTDDPEADALGEMFTAAATADVVVLHAATTSNVG
jgi:hypothetical protein